MSTRLNFLPDERFAPLRAPLTERLQRMADLITPENFPSLLDFRMANLLRDVFAAVKADEGSVWILDQPRAHLVVSYAWGPHAATIAGSNQPLSTHLASTPFITEHR